MEKDFRLTSSEYAKVRGLSVEALRSRRRREIERGNFICVDGKYWWKNDRPFMVKTNGHDRRVPGPGAVSNSARSPLPAPRKRNRGALARGEKPDYPNWKMEDRNRVLALAKIRDDLGDEVVDEITPELFDLAKKRVAEKKLKKAESDIEKADLNTEPPPTGLDRTPIEYGRKLTAKNLEQERRLESSDLDKWQKKTNTKFREKSYQDLFGYRHTKLVVDFDDNARSPSRPPPYYVGEWIEPGSVEIDTRDFTPDDREPEFKNKIEESIYRLKKNK